MPKSWKLSEQDKHTIALRYAEGEPAAVIASSFGVHPWIVSYHAHRWGVTRRKRTYRRKKSWQR
jgi:hypothetical protein